MPTIPMALKGESPICDVGLKVTVFLVISKKDLCNFFVYNIRNTKCYVPNFSVHLNVLSTVLVIFVL